MESLLHIKPMMIQLVLFSPWLLSLLARVDGAFISSRPTPTPTINERAGPHILAIVPTTKGQIGINPVESDLGDATTYWGSIGSTDTQYITTDDTTTKVTLNFEIFDSEITSLTSTSG